MLRRDETASRLKTSRQEDFTAVHNSLHRPRLPLRWLAALRLALALLVASCPSLTGAATPVALAQAPAASPGGLHVVATTTQVEDFVANVGGDRITLLPVLAPDDDPHSYQPTANDARSFASADVVFANGVGLETWLDTLLNNLRPGTTVVKLGDQSGIQLLQGSGEEQTQGDPHVWQDPTNAQKMVARIRDTLVAADPDGAPTYQANATAYGERLGQLDQWISQQIQTIPVDQRTL